ncbi:MAG: hypothetical protein JXQ73_21525 [Phycisphaerae bacterium]|nr:hypothetical protein [Phycisphaerae bacterium]
MTTGDRTWSSVSVAIGAWRLIGAALWVAAILIPLLGLVVSLATGPVPRDGWWPSSRQMALLGKTAGMAAMGAIFSLAISLPTIRGLCRLGARRRRGPIALLVAVPLLLPPYVYVFGWDRVIPISLIHLLGDWAPLARTVWVWAGWSWPIPALVLASGWQRVGHGAYRAALLDADAPTAFRLAALPLLAGHAAIAMIVLWVLFMIEYNAPHACSAQVFATELLAWAQSSRHAVDVVAPALPLTVVVIAGCGAVLVGLRGRASEDDRQEAAPVELGVGRLRPIAPVLAVFLVTVVLPVGGLVVRLASWDSFVRLWRVYDRELIESVAIAAACGLAVVWVGTALVGSGSLRWARRTAVGMSVVVGLMPAALVGQAVVAAYQRVDLVYDHWPVMVLTQVARWGWIGCLAAWLVARSAPESLVDQARADGAGEVEAEVRVGWRDQWPVLAAAIALVGALSLAEVPAMSMVRPPGIGWIAQTLMEKFHRFEDQMLVTICCVLAAAPIPAILLSWVAWRRREAS